MERPKMVESRQTHTELAQGPLLAGHVASRPRCHELIVASLLLGILRLSRNASLRHGLSAAMMTLTCLFFWFVVCEVAFLWGNGGRGWI